MHIAIPVRKNVVARRLAETRPELNPSEIARLAGTNRGNVLRAIKQESFGRDRAKSVAR